MPSPVMLEQLKYVAGALAPTDTLGAILRELIAVAQNNCSFRQSGGSANTVALYKNGALWGQHVNFKPDDLPSFVHELTHASCLRSYQSDFINYMPPNTGGRPALDLTTAGAIPGAPADTQACKNETLRRQAVYNAGNKTFLELCLRNLEAWVNVAKLSTPNPFMSKQDAKKLAEAQKQSTKKGATLDDFNKLVKIQGDNSFFGRLVPEKKKSLQETKIAAEEQRKKDYLKERIAYGLNGMSGLGDVHFEYDTVVNQMLFQMYMWGFRPQSRWKPSLLVLAEEVRSSTVPGFQVYALIEDLAKEAYDRRTAAAQIANGAAPPITAPVVMINPPPAH